MLALRPTKGVQLLVRKNLDFLCPRLRNDEAGPGTILAIELALRDQGLEMGMSSSGFNTVVRLLA